MTARFHPHWAEDERLARAVWSRLAESGDGQARKLRSLLGPGDGLRAALGGGPPHAYYPQTSKDLHDFEKARQRWGVRLPLVAPESDLESFARVGGRFIIPSDDDWPLRLGDLGEHTPVGLWVRGAGNLAALTPRSLALVGSRSATRYGQLVCGELAEELARHGFTIISGAAIGIDVAAHRAAIGVQAPTVAVLACGADLAYPRGHARLLDRIAEDGAVVSELPPGCTPTRYRFLERNRMIAAMAAATIVVEAAWRSGALNTARLAGELNRPLGAVPGPVTTPTSTGCHRLIRSGQAVLVTDATEAAELAARIGDIEPSQPRAHLSAHDGLSGETLRVWEALPVSGWHTVEQISREAGVTETEARTLLGDLTTGGRAERSRETECWRRPRHTRVTDVYGDTSLF